LLWAAALTLSPLVLGLLGWAEWEDKNDDNTPPNKKAALPSTFPKNSGTWSEKLKTWNRQRKARQFLAKHTRPSAPVAINEERETLQKIRNNRGTESNFPALHSLKITSNVSPIKGHNKHTESTELNGLRYASEWLHMQKAGRIKRESLAFASKVKSREGVNKVIQALLNNRSLYRYSNGQLFKPEIKMRGRS